MRLLRILGFVVLLIAASVLGVRAGYLNIVGRPDVETSVALGITVLALCLVAFPPALRPPRRARATHTRPAADPRTVDGHGDAGAELMAIAPSLGRLWLARMLLLGVWLARSALFGYVWFFVAQELDRGFNPTLLEFAVAAQLLALLWQIGHQLVGFQFDWSGYRGWAGVRTLANVAVTAVLAGYAFVLADLVGTVLSAVWRFTYRTLDGMWHVPWFNIPIVVAVCVVFVIVLAVVVSWVQKLIARVLGPRNALGETLDELRIVRWEGDPRDLWRPPYR